MQKFPSQIPFAGVLSSATLANSAEDAHAQLLGQLENAKLELVESYQNTALGGAHWVANSEYRDDILELAEEVKFIGKFGITSERANEMKMNDIGSNSDYAEEAFTFEQVSELSGDALLEFGAPWCGHCQAASSAIKEVVSEHSRLRHIKIYDGKGKPLGRAFKVKLWPTLILLHDGNEVARIVRPLSPSEVRQLMSKIS